jgi:hypothetical protein
LTDGWNERQKGKEIGSKVRKQEREKNGKEGRAKMERKTIRDQEKYLYIETTVLQVQLPFLLSYLRSWARFAKPPVVQLLNNFPIFYGTRRFIVVFTRALHWSLS